jgi:hypothetical protein
MHTSKRIEGQVEYNDGEFAEVLTYGIEGIEKNLHMEEIQLHRDYTEDTPQQFQQRFPVGTRLSIVTTTEIIIDCGENVSAKQQPGKADSDS